jgi:hypothetical protein
LEKKNKEDLTHVRVYLLGFQLAFSISSKAQKRPNDHKQHLEKKIRLTCSLLLYLANKRLVIIKGSEEYIAKKVFLFLTKPKGSQSKRMSLAQTTQDHYASLLLYQMSPCSSKSKYLFGQTGPTVNHRQLPVVMHTSARCQTLSLPSINYGKTKMEKKNLWADITKPREQITQINGDKRLNDISTQNGLRLKLAKNCRQYW